MYNYKISVVIPVYNASHLIGSQLEALNRQSFTGPFDIILSDNGSSDDLNSAVNPWRKSLDIKIIDSSQRQGAAYARNVGVLAADSDFIAFCDADDIVSPRWLETHVELLIKFPDSIIMGTLHKVDDRESLSPDSKIVKNIFYEEKESYKIFPLESDKSNIFEAFGTGGNMSIKRDRYITLGGMDCSYSGASEDNDLVYRNLIHGGMVVIAQNARIAYRQRVILRKSFKQQYNWGKYDQLLLMRFSEYPSIKRIKLRNHLKTMAKRVIKIISRDKDSRMELIRLGYDLGAVYGYVKFNRLGLCPERETMK
ncbi:MAG: glycosyltransferase family 2 protein [Rothia sp. (in: high G+C Gram-positive bacteria)]|nr:glycosyltransferase family 2 protein [Rothia sp. (in: high G+C Gram-positive bacteria)]